jgi:hypothetical protein
MAKVKCHVPDDLHARFLEELERPDAPRALSWSGALRRGLLLELADLEAKRGGTPEPG